MTSFYSHPGVLLENHLVGVALSAKQMIQEIFLEGTPVSKVVFQDIAYATGLFHDIGKFTTFFQKRLIEGTISGPETHHSCLSALIGAEIARLIVERAVRRGERMDGNGDMLPVIVFMAVRRHHGGLLSPHFELNDEETTHFNEWAAVRQQARDLISNTNTTAEISRLYHDWLESKEDQGILCGSDVVKQILAKISNLALEDSVEKIIVGLRRLYRAHLTSLRRASPETRETKLGWYFLSQLLFSVLVDSDKKFAMQVETTYRPSIPAEIVGQYRKTKFDPPVPGSLNELRAKFHEEVKSFTTEPRVDPARPILSINAPTGIGKTLAVLSFALGLREKTERVLKYLPRIIYCLPFTSIIDQNHDIILDVLANGIPSFRGNEECFAIKHHHLTRIEYRVEGAELSNDQALALIESWDSEIITTTFVQLFETLLGHSNKALKKFHSLANAIIVLDEVQSFPPHYWALLRSCFLYLARHFNARIIMVTATRPAIFEDSEVQEVIGNPAYYFGNPRLDRIALRADLEQITISTLALGIIGGKIAKCESRLIVVNTIPASIELHDTLLSTLPEAISLASLAHPHPGWEDRAGSKTVLVYLSTNITPVERRERIQAIKTLAKCKKKFIAVTTQMVEAGVDIDAGAAVRDIGPLDSIIQVSGRCNRNAKSAKGNVTVVSLVRLNNRQFATDVYDPQLLRYTQDALAENPPGGYITEAAFPGISKLYFSRVKSQCTHTKDYIRILEEMQYHNPKNRTRKDKPETVSDFHLISEDQEKTDVFVDRTPGSAKARRSASEALKLMAIATTKDAYFKARASLTKAMKEIREHIVQIPPRYCSDLPQLFGNDDMRMLEGDAIGSHYDPQTGFIRT